MMTLYHILIWMLGGGVGLFLLGKFLDTISLRRQGHLYWWAKKLDRRIKKLLPLQFIFEKLGNFSKIERRCFGKGAWWWLQSILVSLLLPTFGVVICIALLPALSQPRDLKSWVTIAILFGLMGVPPCWFACATMRLALNAFLKRKTWISLGGIAAIPIVAVLFISFLALIVSALIYFVTIRWASTIGFSIDDLRALCDLEVILSIFYGEIILNISLLPAYALILVTLLVSGIAGTAKYVENGFQMSNLHKKGERSFFTLALSIAASWAVGVYLVIAGATYLLSAYEDLRTGEIQSLTLIAKTNLINTNDFGWKLYIISSGLDFKSFGAAMIFNRQAMLDRTGRDLAQLNHALTKTVVFLPHGKSKGTYHFSFQSTVATSDNGAASATVTLRELLTGKDMLPQHVACGQSFSISTDLLPELYAIHSAIDPKDAIKYLDAWGPIVRIIPGGRVVVMLEPEKIAHELRIPILAPDPNGEPTVTEDHPVLKWTPILNTFIYVVNWGRYAPPETVDITGKMFGTKMSEAPWPEDLDDGKKYEWLVTAFDVNGNEIAVSDPHRFFSTGGRNAFTTGQIATIPSGTPSLGVAIAKAKVGDKGIRILGVGPLSAAQSVGLQPGDLVTAFNGTALSAEKPWELALAVRKTSIGQVVKVRLLRDGQSLDVSVTVKAAP